MILFFSLILIISSGCSGDQSPPDTNNEFTSGIIGAITNISYDDNNNITSILVESELETTNEGYFYDKAYVSITEVTKVYIGEINVSVNELKQGMNVKIIFYGPVAESYPVQAKAKTISIIENKPSSVTDDNFISGIFGVITDITYDENNNVIVLLVEGDEIITGNSHFYDKARISITDITEVILNNDEEVLVNELKQGMLVEVIFYGGIDTSYPIQAMANSIKIIEE